MVQNHLARLAAPKTWTIARKKNRWTAKPSPGPYGLNESITINLLLKELLKVARTTKEVRNVLNNRELKIDGVVRQSYKYPVGLMDVVSIEKLGENFRTLLDGAGRFYLLPITKEEAGLKLLEIKNKAMINGGKLQLTFHDGRTVLVDRFEGSVGDSVLFDLNKKTIVELLKLEKGVLIYLVAGKHVGKICKVKNILKTQDLQKAKVVFEENGEEIITLMDYGFVVGKDKPVIKVVGETVKKKEESKSHEEETEKAEKVKRSEKIEGEKVEKKTAKKENKEGKQ